MSKGKRVGFFGGSFDPIHLGHLHLAIELSERHHLDEVFFCPTSQSPHKTSLPSLASKEERRSMVTAAIAPLPLFTLLDIEIQKQEPCYTIDTMETLLELEQQKIAKQNEKPKSQYFLLLGEDSLDHLDTWKDIEELLDQFSPLIGTRTKKTTIKPETFSAKITSKIKKGITPIPIIEIRSTEIRQRLKNGLYCGHLLPAKVWDYVTNQCKAYNA